jgi:putative membrane protein
VTQDKVLILAVRWLILAAAVWIAAEIVEGIHLEGFGNTLVVAAVLGLLNLYLRPVLFWLSLPFTIITFGLFLVVLNAIVLLLADWIINLIDEGMRFEVDDFWAALFGAIIISIVSWFIGIFVSPEGIARNVSGRGW